jgi:hypothetical protein
MTNIKVDDKVEDYIELTTDPMFFIIEINICLIWAIYST